MKSIFSVLAATALVLTLAAGASAKSRSDARIESAVRRSFVYRHYLENDSIKVESTDGVVTLTGNVSEDFHKTLAKETASAQTGVKSVDDQLAIQTPGPTAGSDAWLTTRVKTALLFHGSVSAVATDVDSKDGVVTLTGRAGSQAQKDLTAEYAADVDGVKDVRNQLTVDAKPSRARRLEGRVDDASVTAGVKLELLFHRSTSAVSTGVRTSRGVVTLSGKASSAAEKDLTEKIAGDVAGVKRVVNDIVVD